MPLNCLIVDDEVMSRMAMKHLIEKTDSLFLSGICESAIEAINFLHSNKVDIVFLDIEMPEMNGMEMVRTLREAPKVILVTSHTDYAIEAFEYDVTDYIVKPVTPARFLKAISKVISELDREQTIGVSEEFMFVKKKGTLVKVQMKDISYVEAFADYVVIKTDKESFTIHSTMKGIEAKLAQGNFARVHRSYIVRLDRIDLIEDTTIAIGQKVIPIGSSYKDELKKRLNLI